MRFDLRFLGEIPTVHLADLIAQAHGNARDIGAGHGTVIDFLFQPVHLRFADTGLECPIEVMVGAIVMDGITAEVSKAVHIP